MSLISTLTMLGRAGSGGTSYWINQATISAANGWSQTSGNIVYNDNKIICNGREDIQTGTDYDNLFTYDLNGTQVSANSVHSGSGSAGNYKVKSIYWDGTAWYTEMYGSAGQTEYQKRYDYNAPTSTYWAMFGDNNNDDFRGGFGPVDSTNVGFISRSFIQGGSRNSMTYNKVNKSTGAMTARYDVGSYTYDNYAACVDFAKYGSSPDDIFIGGYVYISNGLRGTATSIAKSNGAKNFSKYIYYTDFEGAQSSGQCYAVCADDSGGALYAFHFTGGRNPLVYLDSSGNVSWQKNTDSPVIDIKWDDVNNNFVIMVEYRCSIIRCNNSGTPIGDAFAIELTGYSFNATKRTSSFDIDVANNIAYINASTSNADYRLIIKRPLDNSLDGTYGAYTLSSGNTSAQQITTQWTPFTFVNNSISVYADTTSFSTTTANFTSNSRISSVKQNL